MRKGKQAASSYLLRDIPDDVHSSALEKARSEGRNLRWVLIQALRDYAEGRWKPQPRRQ